MTDDKKRAGSLRRAFLFAIAVQDQKYVAGRGSDPLVIEFLFRVNRHTHEIVSRVQKNGPVTCTSTESPGLKRYPRTCFSGRTSHLKRYRAQAPFLYARWVKQRRYSCHGSLFAIAAKTVPAIRGAYMTGSYRVLASDKCSLMLTRLRLGTTSSK